MTIVRTIAKNTFFLFIGELISKLSFFALSISIARFLGVEQYGLYAFSLSFASIFIILSDLGLNAVIIRDVAQQKERTGYYLVSGSLVKLMLTLFSILVLGVMIFVLHYPYQTSLVVSVICIALLIQALAYIPRDIFHGHQRMELDMTINLIEKGIIVILSMYALYQGYNLFAIALIFLFSGIVSTISSFLLLRKCFPDVRFEWKKGMVFSLFRESSPWALSTFIGILYLRMDTVLLSFLQGNMAVGFYSAAYQLVESLTFIPIIFINAVFPVYSHFFTEHDKLAKSLEKSLHYLAIIALPIAAGTIVLAERFIPLFYGDNYTPSILALQILMVNVITFFLYRPFAYALIALDRKQDLLYANLVACLFNLVLGLLLIPKYSFYGAAIASVTASFLLLALYALAVHKFCHVSLVRLLVKPAIASILMGSLVYWMKDSSLGLIIVVAICVYGILLLMLRTFTKEDFFLFKEVVHKVITR